jgi:TPR repeat protein
MIAWFGRAINRPDDRDATGRSRETGPDVKKGEADMASVATAVAQFAGEFAHEPIDAVGCFDLGMIYSAGAGVSIDLVQAHKWFNIAAMRGHCDAAGLRREVAEQMSDAEIGCAQRAARDWLKSHPHMSAPVPAIRAAA